MIENREVYVLDINTEYLGIPASTLMENAGRGVAEFIKKRYPSIDKILFLCGTGNNGGDGFVAARYLMDEFKINLFLLGDIHSIKSSIARRNYYKLQGKNIALYDKKSIDKIDFLIQQNDLIVDALLGVGVKGSLREPYAMLVSKINQSGKPIVSIDIPTGFATETAVKPDYTVTFHDIKEGMTSKNCGVIKIVDIGIPKEAYEYIGPGDLIVYYPRPSLKSHKGENGKLLIIGGGPYSGAPSLSALAALRTGVDLVYIASPKKVSSIIASYSPNLIIKPLLSEEYITSKDIEVIRNYIKLVDAVIVGPGAGRAEETLDALTNIVRDIVDIDKPLVIDADAIKAVGRKLSIIENSKTVITPHIGEFTQLTGIKLSEDIDERKKVITNWASKLGVSIYLKGHIDILSNGRITRYNRIHNVSMTVGGTGDVLAGIIGALLSKGLKPIYAMRAAAFLNGEAGNNVFQEKSYGLLPTDIIEEIPNVLKKYL